jgi:DNA-binding transcriptional MerR regulator
MPSKSKRPRKKPMGEVAVPDKLYFRIGEVARLAKLPTYVLRFWETEFPQLKVNKSSTGQRLYRRRDVENVLHIRKLLYEEGFTIAGARQHLKQEVRTAKKQPLLFGSGNGVPRRELLQLRRGLQEILRVVSPRKQP